MIQSAPDAGGTYTFAKRVNGKDYGFLAAWFILLTYLAILWANITSLPLFTSFFFGDILHVGFHYRIFSHEVWLGEALLSMCAIALVGALCTQSSRLPNRIMSVAALTFAVGFTACAVIAVARHGAGFSYAPLYAEGSGAFVQVVRIAAISPWAFIGFENVSHFSEEYDFPVRKVRPILLCSVLATTALYILVSLLSISAYPPKYSSWMAYISDMGNLSGIKAVPAFYAANHYLGQTGVAVLMLALLGVIVTSLISNLLALSRLLYAAGRGGEAPEALGNLNDRGIPANAIAAVVAVSLLVPFLGRTAIGWIVDVTTLGATIIYGMISYTAYRHAQEAGLRREQLTGTVGLALMAVFLLLLLIPGLLPFHAMETESYILFIAWSVLGLAYYHVLVHEDSHREYGQNYIVWIILLVLVLFASMMWVSRATETAAGEAVQRIFEYHESHSADDSIASVREDRVAFLQEQADRISNTNVLYTAVSLGLFLLSTTIMLSNYRDARDLGKRLAVAEAEAEAARKIAELRASITALMDNMPGLSFSKDARTGVYLACNQAFAEYARKEGPQGVIGLTDAQIFDPQAAAKFAADDRMALSMDVPFIFYEDVLDPAGNLRQLQTTKMKYVDDTGRLCMLGFCQDVDEQTRYRRAAERMQEEHIAYARINALSGDFLCIYIVVPETNRYRELSATPSFETFALPKEGMDFFETTRAQMQKHIYPDDLARVLSAFTRENVLAQAEHGGVYSLSYRLVLDGRANYVQLKAAMVDEREGRRLIVGVNDIDAHIRQEEDYARRLAQAQSQANIDALTGVKNKHAYLDAEDQLDRQIAEGRNPEFAVTILDVNDLKKVNDTEGHKAGDQYLRDACMVVCHIFDHSPVFRVGGDEFAVVSRGRDFERIEELVGKVADHNAEARRTGGIVIACGMAKYEGEKRVAFVFERADQRMYENKDELKSGTAGA